MHSECRDAQLDPCICKFQPGVLHTPQKSPQTLQARFPSPPASLIPTSSRRQAQYSPGTASITASSLPALEMPHSNLGTNHAQPRAGRGGESKGKRSLSVWAQPCVCSALGAWLAAGPALGPWRAARRGVAGTCPCWETWRPRRARMVSCALTSRLLEFTSGFPPSWCQGARAVPTALPRMRRGAFPGRTRGTPQAFSWTGLAGTDGAHQGVRVLQHISKMPQHWDKVRRRKQSQAGIPLGRA